MTNIVIVQLRNFILRRWRALVLHSLRVCPSDRLEIRKNRESTGDASVASRSLIVDQLEITVRDNRT
jgi:hypothetical protein